MPAWTLSKALCLFDGRKMNQAPQAVEHAAKVMIKKRCKVIQNTVAQQAISREQPFFHQLFCQFFCLFTMVSCQKGLPTLRCLGDNYSFQLYLTTYERKFLIINTEIF